MASWLARWTPEPGVNAPGLSPDQGHCVVFLGKTLNSHGASLHSSA